MQSPSPEPPNKLFKQRNVLTFLRARMSPDGYMDLHLTIGIAVITLAVFIFAHIAERVVERDHLVVLLDGQVMQWLQAHATPGRTGFLLFVTP